MKPVNILISHAHDEKALAEAWKHLLTTVSLGAIQVWFSSDVNPGGGMDVGGQWRQQLYQQLKESNYIIAIQTPASANRPWIMWECGVASGIEGERGLIPIVFSMGRGDLSNPLTTYQVYQGEDQDQVREICRRLVDTTELTFNEHIFETAFAAYQGGIRLHRPRRVVQGEQMMLWKTRFEELVQMGRSGEVPTKRAAMYASFGQPFRPLEPSLHDLLSKILLDQKQYQEALQEVDYVLSLVEGDVDLLHRKALILVQMQNLPAAEAILRELFTKHPDLKNNAELASLEGRICRERWKATNDQAALDQAFDAYYRACHADRTQYYPCINAASLALVRKDEGRASELFEHVISVCKTLQQRPVVSYWVDFSAAEALLGVGRTDEALSNYQKALTRTPSPSPRDRESALNGARRMIEAKGMDQQVADAIKRLFT